MNLTTCWQKKTTHLSPHSFEKAVQNTSAGSHLRSKSRPDSPLTSKLTYCLSLNPLCCLQPALCAITMLRRLETLSMQTTFFSTLSVISNRRSTRNQKKSCVQPVFTKTCTPKVGRGSKRSSWSRNNEKLNRLRMSWENAHSNPNWDLTSRWVLLAVREKAITIIFISIFQKFLGVKYTSGSKAGKTLWIRK